MRRAAAFPATPAGGESGVGGDGCGGGCECNGDANLTGRFAGHVGYFVDGRVIFRIGVIRRRVGIVSRCDGDANVTGRFTGRVGYFVDDGT